MLALSRFSAVVLMFLTSLAVTSLTKEVFFLFFWLLALQEGQTCVLFCVRTFSRPCQAAARVLRQQGRDVKDSKRTCLQIRAITSNHVLDAFCTTYVLPQREVNASLLNSLLLLLAVPCVQT